ncbi:MAG: hypothetical protein K9J77_12840 [Rhodoferax sp.]|nr:hypothetical protein [Rhodoferax sp.]
MKNEVLQAELDTPIATQAGLMAIVGSLMATYPNYDKFQLHLTGLLDVLLTVMRARRLQANSNNRHVTLFKRCKTCMRRLPKLSRWCLSRNARRNRCIWGSRIRQRYQPGKWLSARTKECDNPKKNAPENRGVIRSNFLSDGVCR